MYKTRCNNCMLKFNSDEELELLRDPESKEYYKGCPNCKTDSYLMDLDEDSNESKVPEEQKEGSML